MALLSAFFVYWQSGRFVPLIDYSYQAENAYRIYTGQLPYTDFILSLTPGTYVVMALFMKLFGLSNLVQVFYTMLVSFLTLWLSYSVLNRLNDKPVLNLFLIAPLIFCGQGVVPFPSYDINTMLFMLLGLNVLLRTLEKGPGKLNYFLSGFFIALPFLFKPNTGFAFNIITLAVLLFSTLFSKGELSYRNFLKILAGSILVYLLFLLWLIYTDALSNFFEQVFIYPGATRNPMRMLHRFAASFLSQKTLMFVNFWLAGIAIVSVTKFSAKAKTGFLIITALVAMLLVPVLKIAVAGYYGVGIPAIAIGLVSYSLSIWHLAILIVSLILILQLFSRAENKFSFHYLFPAIPLLVSVASFISQGVDGSTYGIWPFMAMFLTIIARYASKSNPEIQWDKIFSVIGIALMITTFTYSNSNTRLKFVSFDGEMQKCTYPGMEHLATPGPWIGEMEEMFRYTDTNIPKNDLIVNIPGEDPFCVATGRKPALPFFQLNWITFHPHSTDEVLAECLRNKIKWVIIKHHTQMPGGFIDHSKLVEDIKNNYKLHNSLKGYDIYYRSEF